ncbi:uncharacterized protein TNCT_258391 [Trichonephila clavata]|uniref:Uncharacterized protein n=1 Tax=Trichonephila clavata TaxID=2740835 RepID=A0A8X6M507_TRICU|nr:uncharacterized protein TNCT_258391 [Trichonephila clavata]
MPPNLNPSLRINIYKRYLHHHEPYELGKTHYIGVCATSCCGSSFCSVVILKILDMALSIYPMLSLRELSMVKTAIIVYNDPVIQDFIRDHGNESFVFPSKEALMFLNATEDRVGQTWKRKEFLLDGIDIQDYKRMSLNFDASRANETFVSGNERRDVLLPFKKWEELVAKKVSTFSLPKCLEPELFEITRTVAIEIAKWIRDLSLIVDEPSEIVRSALCYFQWNSLGRIDREETAKMLIMNEASTRNNLYMLAIHYDLLKDMHIDMRRKIDKTEEYQDFQRIALADSYFKKSTGENNIRYSPRRNWIDYLDVYLKRNCLPYPDLMLVLTQLSVSERETLFSKASFYVLILFVDWPLQRYFLEASELLLPYLSNHHFYATIKMLLHYRILVGRKDFNYISLLKGFWHRSSSKLKESFQNTYEPLYKSLMFTINYPEEQKFPKEKLFKTDFDNRLTYEYQGIKYYLFRTDRIYLTNSYRFLQFSNSRYIEEVSYFSQRTEDEGLRSNLGFVVF